MCACVFYVLGLGFFFAIFYVILRDLLHSAIRPVMECGSGLFFLGVCDKACVFVYCLSYSLGEGARSG